MSERLRNLRILNRHQPVEPIEIEDVDDITDEIEKSLIELKESCDLPTEEVEKAIDSRRKAKYFNFFGKK
jgi:hypothetical protein